MEQNCSLKVLLKAMQSFLLQFCVQLKRKVFLMTFMGDCALISEAASCPWVSLLRGIHSVLLPRTLLRSQCQMAALLGIFKIEAHVTRLSHWFSQYYSFLLTLLQCGTVLINVRIFLVLDPPETILPSRFPIPESITIRGGKVKYQN